MLGRLEVVDGDRHVDLPRGHARMLLALLALRTGEVVSAERSIDQLWGPTPPPTAAKALQGLVSQVRQRLEPGRQPGAVGSILQTRSPGYVLRLDRDDVDVHRFRRLVEAAAGAPVTAKAALLREALGLWRGPALDDFAYEPFAQAPIVELEELRLTALEERVQTDLALDRHAELVAELEGLTAEHPLRERFLAQLMLALYRCGRQAEALEVYRDAQRHLVDELGIEPSPALQELQRSILSQDPWLDAPAARPESGAEPEPSGDEGPGAWLASGRKVVTVVFCDLSPSVDGRHADLEATRPLVREAYREAVDVFERHGGTVERFVGDVVVVVFGLPVAHEDDAARAVRAAVELRPSLAPLNERAGREYGFRLAARFGIDTGEVLVGDPGPPRTGPWGPPLSTAARLQQGAGEGRVLVGEDTRRSLTVDAVLESLPEPIVDAHGRTLVAWNVLDVVPDSGTPRTALAAPMLGRDAELARLGTDFQRAVSDARTRTVTVIGEAGIGKSRLAAKFTADLRPQADVLTGHCPPYGEGITFWPLREMVLQASGGEARDHLRSLLGPTDAEQVASAVGLAETPGRPDALFPAFRHLVEALARERPLVLVFEDVHWAQPTLLDLLEYLHECVREPVLLLCLARPEFLDQSRARSKAPEDADALVLRPLDDGHTRQLIATRSPGQSLSAETSQRIVELAQGNPLFAEQLAAALRDERLPSIPPTVQALLVARLDRLGPAERDVIRSASVLGLRFGLSELLPLLPGQAGPSAARHLQALQRKELLVRAERAGSGSEVFAFRHVLIQLAAYRTLTKEVRARLHEQVAEWMETRAGGEPATSEEIVGYHLERAFRCRRALGIRDAHSRALATRAGERLASAGLRAYARFDVTAATNLFSRATRLLPPGHVQRARTRRHLAEAYQVLGRHGEAHTLLDQMLEEARADREPIAEHAIRLEQARVRLFTGPDPTPLRAIRETAERARAAFEEARDDGRLAQVYYILGLVHLCRGEMKEMERVARQGLAHAERSGEPREEVQARVNVAVALVEGDAPVPECIEVCEELAPWRGMQHPMMLCELAGLYAMLDRFDRARELITLARSLLVERIRGRRPLMFAAQASASVELLDGDIDAGERELRTALRMAQEMQEREWIAQFAAALCRLPHIVDSPEGKELSTLSVATAPAENVAAQALSRMATARFFATRGDRDASEHLARRSVHLVPPSMLRLGADLRVDLAEVLAATGRRQDARSMTEEAVALYERKGNLVGGRRARAVEAAIAGR